MKSAPHFLRSTLSLIGLVAAALFGFSTPTHAAGQITNDSFYKDTDGNLIYSQGGGIFKFGEKYYWYGVKYNGAVTYAANPAAGQNGDTSFNAVTCYSSTDLVNWKFENNILTASTPGLGSTSWIGRIGVFYNASTERYVLVTQYFGSLPGSGGNLYCTSPTPTGDFAVNTVQYPVPGVVNDRTGDQTVFIDTDGTPYLIASSAEGRSNWYVAPFNPDGIGTQTAVRIGGGAGREGNCMFKHNGRYYFCSSDLYGWNASRCYVMSATNIFGPYSAETIMENSAKDFCHVSQTGFFFTYTGTEGTTVVFAGDRWAAFAGNGIGYNQWNPLSFDGATPIFNSMTKWNLDIEKGTWSVAAGNNYILNPTYEADRVPQINVAGWTNDPASTAGVQGNAQPGRTAKWRYRHLASFAYTSRTLQAIEDLPNTNYSLKVWYRSSGGQNAAQIFVRNYGGPELVVNVPAASEWTLASIPKIPVTNGQIEVGFYSDALANQWLEVDDWELIQTPPGPDAALTNIAPDTGSSASDFVTMSGNLVLSGTAGFDDVVAITRLGTGVIGTVTADAAGNWSFDYSGTTLPEGTHQFQISSTDPSTGFTFDSSVATVVVDHTPPAAPTITTINSVSGALVVNGSSEPSATVAVRMDGVTDMGSAQAGAAGIWAVTYATPVSAGTHQFTASATDLAGNHGPASPATSVDTSVEAPVIVAAQTDAGSLSSGAVTGDQTIALSGTASANAVVTITLGGSGVIGNVTADGSGLWTFDYTGTMLAEGLQQFSAAATVAGSTGPSSPFFTLLIDSIPPAVISIVRHDPTTENIANAVPHVVFRVTFSEPVSGVTAGSFVLTGPTTGTIAAVSASSGQVFDVTVNSLNGAGSIRLDLVAPGSGIADIAGYEPAGFTAGQSYVRAPFSVGNGIWTRAATGGLWSDYNNWLDAVVPGNPSNSADFSKVDLLSDNTVTVDSPRSINSLTFADTDPTTVGSWILNDGGNPANSLTLGGTPTIAVNTLGTGANVTLAVPLAGTGGFTKAGGGTLVVAADSSLTGAVNVTAGTLSVGPGAVFTPGTVTVSTGGARLHVGGGTFISSGTTTVTGSNSSVVVDSGIAEFDAITSNNNTGSVVRINGGTVAAGSVSFPRSSDGAINYGTGLIVAGGTATIGTINLGTNNSNALMSVEGGAVTATGAVVLGNQATGGRGGHVRVLSGTFASTDTAPTGGFIVTRRNNNASTANFLGGTSTIEKITLGFDGTVTSGSGTLNVNGGELYVGAGGIVSNAGGTFAANINLTSGLLGAKANWSTSRNVTLPTDGNVAIKAANAADAPFDIALNGVIGGAGGFTKIGAGVLTLAEANTFTGSVVINDGTVRVAGSLAAGGTVEVNAGGILAGDGPIAKPINLNGGGAIAPDGTSDIATLVADTVTWNGGGVLSLDLGAAGVSDMLVLSGNLEKGSPGDYTLVLNATAPIAPGNNFTVATFAGTTFAPNDFTATGLPDGYGARAVLNPSSLRLFIVTRPTITSPANVNGIFGQPIAYSITAANGPTSYSASGLPTGLALNETTGEISGTPTAAGIFVATLGATNEGGTGTKLVTFTIEKATIPLVVGNGPGTPMRRFYTGSPLGATATTVPANLNVTFTYDGSETRPTLPGAYEVVGTVDDPNYHGTAKSTLVIVTTALVRHAPTLNGDLDGSAQVLLPESVTLNDGALVSSDLLVLGSPTVQLNGQPTFVGVQDAAGAANPSSHTVTLNGSAVLRYLVRRVDAIALPTVDSLQPPAGTRNVVLNHSSQNPGNFATVRDLTLNGNVGAIAVPPGAYGIFTASGTGSFILGIEGATEPAVYDLQQLTLNGNASLQLAGPVLLKVGGNLVANGNIGRAQNPRWLTLHLVSGGLTLRGNAHAYGEIIAPRGTVVIDGNATLTGNVAADRLIINDNGALIEAALP
jgi:autotransporter-associated beta strand protein